MVLGFCKTKQKSKKRVSNLLRSAKLRKWAAQCVCNVFSFADNLFYFQHYGSICGHLMSNLYIMNTSYNERIWNSPVSVHLREVLLYYFLKTVVSTQRHKIRMWTFSILMRKSINLLLAKKSKFIDYNLFYKILAFPIKPLIFSLKVFVFSLRSKSPPSHLVLRYGHNSLKKKITKRKEFKRGGGGV
jgi:hypothetical protein